MALRRTVKASIYKGEDYYVGECLEIAVVTQGESIEETLANLQKAVGLHLEGESLDELGLALNPITLITMELTPTHA